MEVILYSICEKSMVKPKTRWGRGMGTIITCTICPNGTPHSGLGWQEFSHWRDGLSFGPFLLKKFVIGTERRQNLCAGSCFGGLCQGKERIRAAMQSTGSWPTAALLQKLESRVIAVCGDMGQPNLGLSQSLWNFIADHVQTIYHNAAAVNYLFNYDKLQAANITGAHEVLRLAFERSTKIFNYVSTTFIFGWAVKETLSRRIFERQNGDTRFRLQSSLNGPQSRNRIGCGTVQFEDPHFPSSSLISPSVTGGGNNIDIAIRLLAFMVNHGIGVAALNQVSFVPADVAANNIVAISNIPDTIGASYHVTRDDLYANMMDITNIMTSVTGRSFRSLELCTVCPGGDPKMHEERSAISTA